MIPVQSELPGLITGPFEVREYFAIFTQHDRYVLSDFLPNHRIMSLANPSSPKRCGPRPIPLPRKSAIWSKRTTIRTTANH